MTGRWHGPEGDERLDETITTRCTGVGHHGRQRYDQVTKLQD